MDVLCGVWCSWCGAVCVVPAASPSAVHPVPVGAVRRILPDEFTRAPRPRALRPRCRSSAFRERVVVYGESPFSLGGCHVYFFPFS